MTRDAMTRTDDESLRRLPEHDMDPARAGRLRHRAHAILSARARPQPAPAAGAWAAYYYRFVEPTALLMLGLSFVVFSFQATVALVQ
jgi:hypothetical protein